MSDAEKYMLALIGAGLYGLFAYGPAGFGAMIIFCLICTGIGRLIGKVMY